MNGGSFNSIIIWYNELSKQLLECAFDTLDGFQNQTRWSVQGHVFKNCLKLIELDSCPILSQNKTMVGLVLIRSTFDKGAVQTASIKKMALTLRMVFKIKIFGLYNRHVAQLLSSFVMKTRVLLYQHGQ